MVESEAKLERVRIAEGLLGVALGFFVGAEGLLSDLCALVRSAVLGDVAQEVSLHLKEEHFALIAVIVWD